MTANELRELLQKIEEKWRRWKDNPTIELKAAAYLCACADALEKGPVAWKKEWPNGSVNLWDGQNKPPLDIIGETHPLYPLAMPAQAQALHMPEPMTDAEIDRIIICEYGPHADTDFHGGLARAIEAEVIRRIKELNE